MRKSLIVMALFLSAITFSFAQSSQKYGHVNSQEIMQGMPGIDSVQTQLMAFQQELQGMYEAMVTEFQKKKEAFDMEAGTMSSSVRKVKENELIALENNIMEFQNGVEVDLQEKQMMLLNPFQTKLQKAIDDVAKENGYHYIFDTQILLYSGGGQDITPLVKNKLGMK